MSPAARDCCGPAIPSRRAMSAAHEKAALSRKVSKSGDTARSRSVISPVRARTDSWSSSDASAPAGQDRPQLVIEVERLARPHEHARSQRDLVLEPEPDRHDLDVADAVCLRAERDAGRAGADRSEPGDVVGRSLGEHRDHAPVDASSASASSKARRFASPAPPSTCRWIGMTPANASSGRTTMTFQSVAFARNRGSWPSAADDEHRVGEAVEVVRDDQRRPPAVEPIEARQSRPCDRSLARRSSRSRRSADQGPA